MESYNQGGKISEKWVCYSPPHGVGLMRLNNFAILNLEVVAGGIIFILTPSAGEDKHARDRGIRGVHRLRRPFGRRLCCLSPCCRAFSCWAQSEQHGLIIVPVLSPGDLLPRIQERAFLSPPPRFPLHRLCFGR